MELLDGLRNLMSALKGKQSCSTGAKLQHQQHNLTQDDILAAPRRAPSVSTQDQHIKVQGYPATDRCPSLPLKTHHSAPEPEGPATSGGYAGGLEAPLLTAQSSRDTINSRDQEDKCSCTITSQAGRDIIQDLMSAVASNEQVAAALSQFAVSSSQQGEGGVSIEGTLAHMAVIAIRAHYSCTELQHTHLLLCLLQTCEKWDSQYRTMRDSVKEYLPSVAALDRYAAASRSTATCTQRSTCSVPAAPMQQSLVPADLPRPRSCRRECCWGSCCSVQHAGSAQQSVQRKSGTGGMLHNLLFGSNHSSKAGKGDSIHRDSCCSSSSSAFPFGDCGVYSHKPVDCSCSSSDSSDAEALTTSCSSGSNSDGHAPCRLMAPACGLSGSATSSRQSGCGVYNRQHGYAYAACARPDGSRLDDKSGSRGTSNNTSSSSSGSELYVYLRQHAETSLDAEVRLRMARKQLAVALAAEQLTLLGRCNWNVFASPEDLSAAMQMLRNLEQGRAFRVVVDAIVMANQRNQEDQRKEMANAAPRGSTRR